MLDSLGCDSVWCWFLSLFPDVHLAIWPNTIDLGLIWPSHPLPVLYSPIFVILSEFKPPLMMGLLEHRNFLLCTGVKSTLIQYISNCLRMNRVGDDRINELGGLNCIIKPSRIDLMDNAWNNCSPCSHPTPCWFYPQYPSLDQSWPGFGNENTPHWGEKWQKNVEQ